MDIIFRKDALDSPASSPLNFGKSKSPTQKKESKFEIP